MKFTIGEHVVISDEYPDQKFWGKVGTVVKTHKMNKEADPQYGAELYSVFIDDYENPLTVFGFEIMKEVPEEVQQLRAALANVSFMRAQLTEIYTLAKRGVVSDPDHEGHIADLARSIGKMLLALEEYLEETDS